ncbi:MAG TPA: glycerophosphodiester phosphodiesterase family protein [Malonomonas sp.]
MSNFFDRFPATGYVCAHRGARSIAPENTLLALEKAHLCGADLWETDVQATADGKLILFHDHSLERTTDILNQQAYSSRKPWKLADFSLNELNILDAGSWFLQSDPFGTVASGEVTEGEFAAIKGQHPPLLLEALDYCRRHDFPVNLEIKDQTGTAADRTIVGQILAQLKTTETESLALISSFNHKYLRQVKQQNPALATAALVENRHPQNLLNYLHDLNVDAYHPDQRITDPLLIRQLVAKGMRVNLWTINDLAKARAATSAGATFICTDWPQRLLAPTEDDSIRQ